MIGRRHPVGASIAAGLLLAGFLPAQERAAGHGAAPSAVRWTDPDGGPLPFKSDEELLAFLRTADVTSEKKITGGVTFPTRLLLEKDGVRVDAIFRDVNEARTTSSFGGGRSDLFFRDSYVYEPAAYELSLLLGLDNVPPATLRKLHGKNGSVQIWVENAMTDKTRYKDNIEPPDAQRWNKQLQMMNVFDALVYNTDRNRGNVLITPDWKLWMIDHTRAFRRMPSLQNPEGINQCERGLYEKLKALDPAVVRQRPDDYLSPYELDALLKRRTLILERLDQLIAEKGEGRVLYTYADQAAEEKPPEP